MTRIDFYQITGDQQAFTCRLIDQVYRRGHRIYVHTASVEQASQLDDDLWTFRPDSFIPHALTGQEVSVPVRIGFDQEPDEHQDVLINLSGTIPHFFSRFERVAEVVPVDKNSRDSARANFSFYKERGYSLKYHEITQNN